MDATDADAGGGGPLVAAPTPGQQQQAQPQMRPIDPAEIKHWTCVWPCYLDGSLTVAQGRRLPKSLCGEGACSRACVWGEEGGAIGWVSSH